jgi:hypothetical protein
MNRQLYQLGGGAIYPRIDGLSSGISAAEQELQNISQSIDQVQSTLGESSGGPQGQLVGGNSTNIINNNIPSGGGGFGSGGQQPLQHSSGLYQFGPGRALTPGQSNTDGSISPMQSPMSVAMRNMAAGGGMMGRQMYGLGSLVKSVTKGAKKFVSGAVDTVTDFAKSDAGKLALAAAGAYYAPALFGGTVGFGPASTYGSFARGLMSPGLIGPMTKAGSLGRGISSALTGGGLGKTLGVFAGGSLLGGVLGQAQEEGDPEGITRNVGALKMKLADAYRNQRTFADAEDEEAAIAQQVERDVSEYSQDLARGGLSTGGRVQYGLGSLVTGSGMFKPVSASMNAGDTPVMSGSGMGGMIARLISNSPNVLEKLKSSRSSNYIDFIDENFNGIDDRREAANGGRIGFAFGNPEKNAMVAANIENLPLNQNPAGVSELDLRETGGFIPPVGVKEKADDIPAMLSNNEFVFTADAVRGMGDGNVNKGAQRMYDMMKKLEKGGRV